MHHFHVVLEPRKFDFHVVAGASVDEITRRSGVAKTTIYRHWPTRGDLLRDACSSIGSRLQEGYSAPLLSVIQRAMQRGELSKSTDAALLVAALTGPLFYRRWFSREPLTSAFAKQIGGLVLRQVNTARAD